MPHWLATLFAILGLIILSLTILGLAWLFSRWMGKVAVPGESRAGGKAGRPSTAVNQHIIAHDERTGS